MSPTRPAVVTLLTLSLLVPAPAQSRKPRTKPAPATSAAAKPKYKAIWEPVNYKQDLELQDVAFVDEKTGWVSGQAGTILKTTDGGDTWTPQLGGDPANQAYPVYMLRFLDAKTGFAIQRTTLGAHLLRTIDGESWQSVGTASEYTADLACTSATNCMQFDGEQIRLTTDAGKNWHTAFKCTIAIEVDGLTRNVGCRLERMHFLDGATGYVLATPTAARDTFVILKTTDSGATWQVVSVTQEGSAGEGSIRFLDANRGFILLYGGKMMSTDDGGKTWKGVAGVSIEGKPALRFAGPVGWAVAYGTMTYSTNGGKLWSARKIAFPASIWTFDLPSQQRGYVVGNHGMIYRYRVVPFDYTVKGMLDAPMMPGAEGAP